MSSADPHAEVCARPLRAELLRGVVLEAADLDRTRAFYQEIFRHTGGEWTEDRKGLRYCRGAQTIEFVKKRKPRALPDSGYHCAYRVPVGELDAIVRRVETAGSAVSQWREDHPSERFLSPYLQDPSGNIVQLVASDDPGILVDHAGIEIHMFDYCEYLYVTVLGGEVSYYHGWRTADLEQAKNWAPGNGDCAPWTRRDNPTYRDFLVADPETGELRPSRFSAGFGGNEPQGRRRVPRPNGQVFVSYGGTRVGLFSATKVRQEPPEEQIKGTPRIVLSTGWSAAEVEEWLRRFPVPQLREGRDFFLRDADGNFSQLACES